MRKKPYLTKSSFKGARNCERWLWNSFHDRKSHEPSLPGSIPDLGDRVGRFAHRLFPGGVEVTEAPYEHEQAAARTRELMADKSVPAIFEAALEYDKVRVRVDVLERLPDNGWGIREVKSTGSIRKNTRDEPLKEKYARDVEIQWWVVNGCGIEVPSIELIYVNKEYKRPAPGFSPEDLFAGMEPEKFFKREEIFREITVSMEDTQAEIDGYLRALSGEEPEVEPSKKLCSGSPGGLCPYWKRCTADKPDDWVDVLYNSRGKQIPNLKSEGKNQLSSLTIEEGRNPEQNRMIRSVQAGQDIVEETLGFDLQKISLPAIHLDFEYLSGTALPLFAGTRPYELVPFQFSAHRLNVDGTIDHIGEFLATGTEDPRQKFSEKLIALLDETDEPIVAYAVDKAEGRVMKELIDTCSDLAAPLERINARIEDLLKIFRANVMLREMVTKDAIDGTPFFSLKNVAPAFVDGFTYKNLGVVSNGAAAVETFFQLTTGMMPTIVDKDGIRRIATPEELRESLLAYCKKDTEATAKIHKKLLALISTANSTTDDGSNLKPLLAASRWDGY